MNWEKMPKAVAVSWLRDGIGTEVGIGNWIVVYDDEADQYWVLRGVPEVPSRFDTSSEDK